MKRSIALLTMVLALAPTISARAQFKVICESEGHDHHYCPVDTSQGVVLDHQLSHAGCWQSDTWGFDRKGIWVSNGCKAEFLVGSASDESAAGIDAQADGQKKGGGKAGAIIGGLLAAGVVAAIASNQHDSDDHDEGQAAPGRLVTCESYNNQNRYCSVGWAQHVELHRQLSGDACRYNRTWGYDRNGIWVSNNCRAEFMIDGHANEWGWEEPTQRGLTLYRDPHYKGRNEVFTGDRGSLRSTQIGNDEATSARVSRGCRARLFEHDNYQGRYTEISGGIPDLRGSRVGDDAISSVQVRCN